MEGFLGWELVLPAGRCLGSLRKGKEDLWVVEEWWSRAEDELCKRKENDTRGD